mgnify:CR=1 FL=1
MLIYIAGTHSLKPIRRIRITKDKTREENIKKVQAAIVAITKKGHIPLVPYPTLQWYKGMDEAIEKLIKETSNNWLKKCDAVYFVQPPIDEESESERLYAMNEGIPVYYNINDIPDLEFPKLSSEAFKAYLVEYEQCMQNYRHTFATIWQAGALFAAISAGIIAFAGLSPIGHTSTGLTSLILVLVPIPIIFWYLGLYRPMNRYCEQDNDRLVQIEEFLSSIIPGLDMRHMRVLSSSRKGETFIKRLLRFKWLLKPRVVEVVSIFGIIMIIIETYLLWVYYLSHWLVIK